MRHAKHGGMKCLVRCKPPMYLNQARTKDTVWSKDDFVAQPV